MRNISELSEGESQFVGALIKTYPAARGFVPERDPAIRELTADLLAEGLVERTEIHEPDAEGIAYRLSDEFAESVRRIAAAQSAGANLN